MNKFLLSLILIMTVLTVARGQAFRTATATAQLSGGFVVGVTVTDGGSGYTNVPPVHLIGGGGTNAVVAASISGGSVTAFTVNNPGSGYSSAPTVNIAPPVVPLPLMSVTPASYLLFTNLSPYYGLGNWSSGIYFLMENISGVWVNQQPPYTYIASSYGANGSYSTIIDGSVTTNTYGLAVFPIPEQATATAQVVNGFVTGITITSRGGGYKAVPTVQIIGGGGTGAQAQARTTAQSGQPPYQVTSVSITSPGSGYTSTPNVIIDPPDTTLQFAAPPTITPMVRIDANNLFTNLSYQFQTSPDLKIWNNFGVSFQALSSTSSTYFSATNSNSFFRLIYIP